MDLKKWGFLLLALMMLLAFAVGCDNGAEIIEDDAGTELEDETDDLGLDDEIDLDEDDFPLEDEEDELE